MKKIQAANAEWCRKLFDSLNDGGRWAVPRSGLVFERRGTNMVLVDRMKPKGDSKLAKLDYQDADYVDTKRHFEAIGISISDETVGVVVEAGKTIFDGSGRSRLH